MTLSCKAAGIPPPMVYWIIVDDARRINGSELLLTNINRSEAGQYRCEASNQCGDASETASIGVYCKFQSRIILMIYKLLKHLCVRLLFFF